VVWLTYRLIQATQRNAAVLTREGTPNQRRATLSVRGMVSASPEMKEAAGVHKEAGLGSEVAAVSRQC